MSNPMMLDIKKETYEVILLAAGSGTRLGASHNKVLLPIGPKKRPMFDYAMREFLKDDNCSQIILVVRKCDYAVIKDCVEEIYERIPEKILIIFGGSERQYSVANGLEVLKDPNGYVMVHDAARPFITAPMLAQLFQEVKTHEACLLAVPASDTIKRVQNEQVQETLNRSEIWQVQTPQAFKSSLLLEAYQKAEQEGFLGNEEGELIERTGHAVRIIPGKTSNFKITSSEDLELAEGLLHLRR